MTAPQDPSAQDPPVPDQSAPDRSSGPTARRRRRPSITLVALAVVVALLATAVVLIRRGTEEYYVFSPGTAPRIVTDASCRLDAAAGELVLPGGTPCARLVVPSAKAHALQGQLYMVDVLVGPATATDYILDKLGLLSHFRAGTQLIPTAEVLGPTPPSQLACEDDQEMVSATEAASVVALRRVGYPVRQNNLGAQVDTVAPGTPAAKAGMDCDDVITSISGHPIHTLADLQRVLAQTRPGQVVPVVVQRPGSGSTSVSKTLRVKLRGTPAQDGQPAQPTRAFLGIVTETKLTFTLPFKVSIDVGDIGGPSAGLALTLGLLDTLSNGDLTGGHRVAATGTMDAQGDVGDVGGVAQKTVAVERAGAQLFLVPPQELAVAEANAGCHAERVTVAGKVTHREVCPKMQVKAVSTLSQAIADLAAIGGHVGSLRTAKG